MMKDMRKGVPRLVKFDSDSVLGNILDTSRSFQTENQSGICKGSVFVQLGGGVNIDDAGSEFNPTLKAFSQQILEMAQPHVEKLAKTCLVPPKGWRVRPLVAKSSGLKEWWLRLHRPHHQTPVHFDLMTDGYGTLGPDALLVTMWIPLHQTNVRTGGLFIEFKSAEHENLPRDVRWCPEMNAGNAVIFSGNTWHGSAACRHLRYSLDCRFVLEKI